MWGAWFGGNGGQKRKDAPKKAILDLRQQLDMLQKRERHLENQMAKQDEIARENVTTNKTGRQSLIGEWPIHLLCVVGEDTPIKRYKGVIEPC